MRCLLWLLVLLEACDSGFDMGDKGGDSVDDTVKESPEDDSSPVSTGDTDCVPGVPYPDADRDGYVAAGTSADDIEAWIACVEGLSFREGEDCDDDDADVHPDQAEICKDKKDTNCDDTDDDGCEWNGEYGVTDDANVSLFGEAPGDYAAFALAKGKDLNEDGYADLIVSAPVPEGYGKAYIVFGPIDSDGTLGAGDATFTGSESRAVYGYKAVNAGNFDGDDDGYDDVVVSAAYSSLGDTRAGAAYIYSGPFTDTGYSPADAAAFVINTGNFEVLGYALDTAGDLDRDGRAELLLGAPGYGTFGLYASGAVYLLYGQEDTGALTLEAMLIGGSSTDEAGAAVSGGRDGDGDGVPDILVGASKNEGEGGTKDVDDLLVDLGAGVSYFVSGASAPDSGTFSLADSDSILLGSIAGESSGFSVSLADDLDEDGYTDYLVGAPDRDRDSAEEREGGAYLVYGPLSDGGTSLSEADLTIEGEERGQNVGASVVFPGDIEADGSRDLLIGANDGGFGGSEIGQACLISGETDDGFAIRFGGTIDISASDACFRGDSATNFTGDPVGQSGDLDNDGYDDLLIGTSGYERDTGLASIFFGSGI